MDDQVKFPSGGRKKKYPGETYLKELLHAASDDEAEEHLTDYEQAFVIGMQEKLAKYGYHEPSAKQHAVLDSIEEKLKKARLL